MIKVSVIIPVYNSEQYLCGCLDSVINQTLEETEIICIDDCSTDSSGDLLQRYAESDGRIRILKNDKNMGQAYARNRALETARGEYIQFLDSDDYLDGPHVLKCLYCIAAENDLDLLKSSYNLKKDETDKGGWLRYPGDITGNIYSGRELLYELGINNLITVWATWTNFVRLKFLRENKISFYEGIIHEDVLYSYHLYDSAKRAMCVDLHTYIYIKRPGSTTTRRKDINHLKGYLVCVKMILEKNFTDSSAAFRYATIKYFLQMYHNIADIIKELDCETKPEMPDPELERLYEMFWGAKQKSHSKYVKIKNFIPDLNTVLQDRKLYVFGAGKAARELLELLNGQDIMISGIFVTDTQRSAKTLLGHRVMGIDSYEHSDNEALFLVAITKKYVGDTIEILRAKGIEKIIYVC